MFRRLAVCLAFSAVCFLNTWVELAQGDSPYFSRFDPLWATVPPVLAWQLLISCGLYLAWRFFSGSARLRAVGNSLFLLSCLIPAGIASIALMRAVPFNLVPIVRLPWFWPVALLAAAPVVILLGGRPASAGPIVRAVLLYSLPALAVVVIQASRTTLLRFPHSAYADGPLASRLPHPPSPQRVVWIIFDGMSEAMTFEHRPAGISLPELDRFRSESLSAVNAHSPAGFTTESLPALILGEHVESVATPGPDSALVKVPSQRAAIEWRSLPNVFDKARRLGFNSALAGWHHPYGRLLNRSLVACDWTAGGLLSGVEEPSRPASLLAGMKNRLWAQVTVFPLIGHFPGVHPAAPRLEEKRLRFLQLLESSRNYVADRSLGLVFLHLMVPHPAAFYTRTKHAFTSTARVGYLDSLELADWTLGQLRRSMEQSGTWRDTAVLISADHGWRTALWRGGPDWTAEEEAASRGVDTSGVPFLVKLPGQTAALQYDKPFDTVVTAEMALDILRGRLTRPEEVPAWLDRNAAAPESARTLLPHRP